MQTFRGEFPYRGHVSPITAVPGATRRLCNMQLAEQMPVWLPRGACLLTGVLSLVEISLSINFEAQQALLNLYHGQRLQHGNQ